MSNNRYSILNATVEQVELSGGTNIQLARHSGIIFADLTETQVTNLKNAGAVVSHVETVRTSVVAPPAPEPVGVAPIISPVTALQLTGLEDLRRITSPPLYGLGMKVAMIDTGIRESHRQLSGKVIYSKNFTSAPMQDGFDHGTGAASILAAVAPECGILNMKVMDDTGEGTTEAAVLAIEDCIDLMDEQPEIAPSVINLSLGTEDTDDPNDVLRVACRAAIARGLWLNAACGNGGPYTGTIMSPACERYVFATGSVGLIPRDSALDFGVSTFSSRGPTKEGLIKPDAVFIGEGIQMASSESDSAVIVKSGTSFAAPFMSGIGVLYQQAAILSEPSAREAALRYLGSMPSAEYAAQMMSAEDLIDQHLQYITTKPQGVSSGKDNLYGYGLPLGGLVAQAAGVRPAVDINILISGVLAVGIVGVMIKAMMTNGQGKRAS